MLQRCNVALQRRVATVCCNGVLLTVSLHSCRFTYDVAANAMVAKLDAWAAANHARTHVGALWVLTYVRHTGRSWYTTRKVHSVLTSFQLDCGVSSRKVLWVL